MSVRILLSLLILATIDRFSTTAQQQDEDYWCSFCYLGGVSIESYNYTTKVDNVEDVAVHSNICARVDNSSSLYNTTCYTVEAFGSATMDCSCTPIVPSPPTAPQQPFTTAPFTPSVFVVTPFTPSAFTPPPFTAPPVPPSTGMRAIIGYSVAGAVFLATASCFA